MLNENNKPFGEYVDRGLFAVDTTMARGEQFDITLVTVPDGVRFILEVLESTPKKIKK